MDRFAEDTTFPIGGYWKGILSDLIEGDAIHMDAQGDQLLVHTIDTAGGLTSLTVSLRRVALANLFSDAFGRPVEGMGQDNGLSSITLPSETAVWIRL